MKKKRKSNLKLILILLVLGLTVGFALLTATLKINGIGRINKATWNIHWENVEEKDGSVTATTPAYIVDEDRTIVEYSIVLAKPGDFYEFTVDAKNDGTIDGMITAIDNKLYDANDDVIDPIPSYLTYTVTYSDGKEIEEDHLLKAGRSEKYRVKVKFKETITEDELPEEDISLSFKFSVTYDQSNTNANIRDAICDASIYNDGDLTESRYLDKCEDYIDDSIYTYDVNENDTNTITITGFKEGYTVAQVKSAVRDLKASKLNNTDEIKIRKVDNHVISFKDGIWAIPSSINGKKVTRISNNSFNYKNITAQLVLPPTLREIEEGESEEDDNQESGWYYNGAFAFNSLTGVALPTDLDFIGSYTFMNNNISAAKIPDKVTTIGYQTFYNNTNLSNLKLSKNLVDIYPSAFAGCTNLTEVDFPYGLKTIESGAFASTSLKKVILPDTVTKLNGGSFYTNTIEEINTGNGLTEIGGGYFQLENVKKMVVGDSVKTISSAGQAPKLTSLYIGKSVETIGEGSFSACKLKKLILPDNVRTVRNGAFSGCSEIEEFDTGDGLTAMNSGTFYLPKAKKIRVGNNVTEINAIGSTPALTELYLGKSLKTITNGSFYLCKLTKIEIPDNVTTVNNGSFSGCDLAEEINIGNGVTRIGSGAFSSTSEYVDGEYITHSTMTNLKKLVLGDGLEEIADGSFQNAGKLEEIVWGKNLKRIQSGSFTNMNYPRLVLPDSLEAVSSGAFNNCGIKYLDTGNGLTQIEQGTFGNNPFETIKFGDNIEYLYPGMFNQHSTLTSVTFGANLKKIYSSTFKDSKITSVDFSNCTALENIDSEAFRNNNISSLNLGSSVQTIGTYAFAGNNLSGELSVPGSVKTLSDYSFQGNSLTSLSLSVGLEYLSGFNNNQIGSIWIPTSVTTIGTKAFMNCPLGTSLSIPANVKEIKQQAFDSNHLTSLSLRSGLEIIGPRAFIYNQIRNTTIPSTVKYIGDGAFSSNRFTGDAAFVYARNEDGSVNDTHLASYAGYNTSVTLPSTVTEIGDYAFYATFITNLTNYSQVTKIGEYGLSNNLITTLNLPDAVTEAPYAMCFANRNLANLTLGSGLTTIGNAAFEKDKLTTVTIPPNVTSIGGGAFGKNSNSNTTLTTIINQTGRSFNWGSIVNGSSGYEFETGTITNSAGDVTVTN